MTLTQFPRYINVPFFIVVVLLFSQAGEVSLLDYDCFVAHTNMMLELTPLRGLMKKNFPQVKSGKTLGNRWKNKVELTISCCPPYLSQINDA